MGLMHLLPSVFGFHLPDKATTQAVVAIADKASGRAQYFVSSNGDCGTGEPCYSKIQEAIDAAPDGSDILVRQGIYNESISLGIAKTVYVQGGYDSEYSQQTDDATFVYGQTLQASSGSLKYQMLSIRLQPVDTWTDPVTGMVFVWVEGGCYKMGCGDWTDSCQSDEYPAHEVCVDGFWIGKYEVTQGQWKQIMGNNPSWFDSGDSYPVEQVTWDDCQKFIDYLNSRSGSVFRFPHGSRVGICCQERRSGREVCRE